MVKTRVVHGTAVIRMDVQEEMLATNVCLIDIPLNERECYKDSKTIPRSVRYPRTSQTSLSFIELIATSGYVIQTFVLERFCVMFTNVHVECVHPQP